MTLIVALTGGIGSGKSAVAESFASLGIPIVDADIIARQIVEPGTPALNAIAQHFGTGFIRSDGTLDRSALREKIFNAPDERVWLNQLLHPIIRQETEKQFAAVSAPYLIWVVPLLLENQLQTQANRVLVVDIDRETQLERTITRDHITRELAEKILAAQTSREKRLEIANDVIDNSGSYASMKEQVAALHEHYLSLSAPLSSTQD